ncbi:hypothetical protein [Paeniclostridium hominis]|uniref:hypothetical protein n=1 Tax=Paeniclostridium hominis TaxID=2764329 RepID=UPI0022E45BF1|nr:hypothetical protein [Paeniclostridium hominis]
MKHKFKYLISIVIVSSFLLGFSNKVIALSKDNGIYRNIYIEDIVRKIIKEFYIYETQI